jgi:hypothetical protein
VLLGAARRILIIFGGAVAVTVVLSLLIGVAAGAGAARSVSVGLYLAGAALLVGCFVTGARGPLRGVARSGETVPLLGARRVRRATAGERSDAARTAIFLFALGLVLIVFGALIDPAHKAF